MLKDIKRNRDGYYLQPHNGDYRLCPKLIVNKRGGTGYA
jgi:hypothetical protein